MDAPRIALFLNSGSNDYQRLLEEDCIAAARRRNASVQVFAANTDHDTQERQIRAVLAQPLLRRPTVILVCPVREASLRLVAREAVAQGIGWVLLNRWSDYVHALREEFPRVPIFAVSPNQQEIGQIQARQFLLLAPRGGELVYIRGPLGTSSAQRRFTAMQDVLVAAPFKVVAINSDWTSDGGERAMREWIQVFNRGSFPEFIVGAQSDNMAVGARLALLEWAAANQRAVENVRFTGCDGLAAQGQRLVSEGVLAATVVVPSVASRAIDELGSMLQTGRAPSAEILLSVASYPELATLERTLRAKPK
ncbi:MAG TPA: substrate-binding domain-containing protein [Polyangiaceae bacterium]|jgi:ABC-type sugar transport system substrate-binding protein|nr:substrate-binding domain-containing protein [Polyangiaceae bacterium]